MGDLLLQVVGNIGRIKVSKVGDSVVANVGLAYNEVLPTTIETDMRQKGWGVNEEGTFYTRVTWFNVAFWDRAARPFLGESPRIIVGDLVLARATLDGSTENGIHTPRIWGDKETNVARSAYELRGYAAKFLSRPTKNGTPTAVAAKPKAAAAPASVPMEPGDFDPFADF